VQTPFGFDLENAIDDWVFACFFVGNDFLPHMPTLEIREGAIDMLMALYKRLLPTMGGYMTHNGDIVVSRVLMLLSELAKLEDTILSNRRQEEARRRERTRERERRCQEQQQQQQQ
jgi:5'-3' exoribonuclease 2